MDINLSKISSLDGMNSFLSDTTLDDEGIINLSSNGVTSIPPLALSFIMAQAMKVQTNGGTINLSLGNSKLIAELVKMDFYKILMLSFESSLDEESSGKFIPLTQLINSISLTNFIRDLVPLLHTTQEKADIIKYVISEIVRNVLEHSDSHLGAFVCGRYNPYKKQVELGICDVGIGIKHSIQKSHITETHEEAILLALTPGITGTTRKIEGTFDNAGMGLFFSMNMAKVSGGQFFLYSGDTSYIVKKTPTNQEIQINANPKIAATIKKDLPLFYGTLIGIEISTESNQQLNELLVEISNVARLEIKRRKKNRFRRPNFI
ncbi:MAG: hypothetical protein V1859_09360 [archaeon]